MFMLKSTLQTVFGQNAAGENGLMVFMRNAVRKAEPALITIGMVGGGVLGMGPGLIKTHNMVDPLDEREYSLVIATDFNLASSVKDSAANKHLGIIRQDGKAEVYTQVFFDHQENTAHYRLLQSPHEAAFAAGQTIMACQMAQQYGGTNITVQSHDFENLSVPLGNQNWNSISRSMTLATPMQQQTLESQRGSWQAISKAIETGHYDTTPPTPLARSKLETKVTNCATGLFAGMILGLSAAVIIPAIKPTRRELEGGRELPEPVNG